MVWKRLVLSCTCNKLKTVSTVAFLTFWFNFYHFAIVLSFLRSISLARGGCFIVTREKNCFPLFNHRTTAMFEILSSGAGGGGGEGGALCVLRRITYGGEYVWGQYSLMISHLDLMLYWHFSELKVLNLIYLSY